MPLDPYFADKIAHLEGVTGWTMDDPEVVAKITAFFASDPWDPPADVEIEDIAVAGPTGDVPVRVYTPRNEAAAPLLWLHGGGFAAGDLDTPEAHMVAAELASRAGAVVYSVAYRLASPDVHFPAPVDDVAAVWRWIHSSAASPLGPPAIGGASAGAAIALSTAMRIRDEHGDEPRAILLAYPFLHFPTPALSFAVSDKMEAVPRLLRFTNESIEDMVRNYVGAISDIPREAMPGAGDLSGLPKVVVLVSELDDLGPSGDLIVKQIAEAGGEVDSLTVPGVPHGHLNWVPQVPAVEKSLQYFASHL